MQLLYRGFKKEDEFVVDYISRIATKNGYANLGTFKKELRYIVDRHQSFLRSGLYDQAKWRIGLELCLSRNVPCDEYRRVTLSKCFLWRKEPAVCDKCFISAPYIRFYWWFAAYKICHIHDNKVTNTNLNSANCEQNLINRSLEKLIPNILETSLDTNDCQKETLNELERCWCDFKILNALNFYFDQNEYLKQVLLSLEVFLQSASTLHDEVDLRISKMAHFLAASIGSYWFWMRIISLLIFNHLSGLRSSFPVHEVAYEYRKIGIYFLTIDKQLGQYVSKILDCRSTKETLSVPLGNLLLSDIQFDAEFIHAYRYSLFRCKTLDYFKQFSEHKKYQGRTINDLFSDTKKFLSTSRES